MVHRVKVRRRLWDRLSKHAEDEEITIFEVIDRVMTDYLDEEEEEEEEDEDDEEEEDEEWLIVTGAPPL